MEQVADVWWSLDWEGSLWNEVTRDLSKCQEV